MPRRNSEAQEHEWEHASRGDRLPRRAPRAPSPARPGAAALAAPPDITLMPLPPDPELNPVENIWQFMRDNWLSNRIFKSYDDVVDPCCHAWNKLFDRP